MNSKNQSPQVWDSLARIFSGSNLLQAAWELKWLILLFVIVTLAAFVAAYWKTFRK